MQTTICILIFLFMIISFTLNKIPMALTSMLGMVALVATGCVDSKTALGNIGSSTVITMIAMFIIAAGLNRTQMINKLSKIVYKVSKGSFTKVLASYVIVTFILGQFIPSITATFVLVCPLVVNMCEEMHISPSKMMYSIALVVVATSFTITPIGPYAASFVEDNGYLMEYGITNYTYTMFTEMSIKIWVSLFVLVWAIFFAPKFAPDKPVIPIKVMQGKSKKEREPLKPFQEVLGYLVFIIVIICLIFQNFGLPLWLIPAIGACILVLSGVLSEKEAIDNMCLDIVMLYIGVVTLGSGFANTGAGDLIGGIAGNLLSQVHNRYIIGAIVFIAAFVMTSLLYNRAVSKILVPLVLVTCVSLNCDPRGLMELCYIGSMCSLVTPMATSVVPLMMGAGGYNEKTLLKMGWLPSIIMCIISVAVAMTLYPCI